MQAGNLAPGSSIEASVGRQKNRAMALLEKGTKQDIEVNLKTMLDKVVLLLGAKNSPVYSLLCCEGSRVKYTISFEIKYGDVNDDFSVEGMECSSADAAEANAVLCAFNHIMEVCSISVCDFSSRLAKSYVAHNTASCAVEAIGMVKKIIDSLDVALWKCKEFGVELDRKAMRESISSSVDTNANVYTELSKYMLSMVKSFSVRSYAARNKLKRLEEVKARSQGKADLKRKGRADKGDHKTVLIPSKALLDLVLAHFGLPKAFYSSSLHRCGMVKSVVQFRVPYLDHLRLCGVIGVKSKADRTARAEENAAFEALLLIEQNFTAKIVDINYTVREEAEGQQKMLMDLLGQIIETGEEVKELWDGVIQAVSEKVEETKLGADDSSEGNVNIANKVCYDGLVEVVEVSDDCYSESWQHLSKLKKFKSNLFGSKLKLGMITVPYSKTMM